jgi:hypothetical protein
MNIDQRTVVSSISDYEDDIDYEIAEGTVEQNIDYLDIYDNKTKMNKLITALKKDVNKNGIYVPKEEQTCFSIAIYYRKSSSNYYYDDTVSVLLYIPETYTNTVNLLKEYDYYNLGYCYIKDYDYYLDEENPKLYQSNQTVYFEVPDNWDKNIDLQCMVYDEDLYSLCYIDSKITKCTKVSENVWSYTLPDTKKYSKEYGGNENAYKTKYIMFYQHGNEKINLTGLIEFSDDANGKMLTLGKQKITDYREFQNSMYEYDWVKFNN